MIGFHSLERIYIIGDKTIVSHHNELRLRAISLDFAKTLCFEAEEAVTKILLPHYGFNGFEKSSCLSRLLKRLIYLLTYLGSYH